MNHISDVKITIKDNPLFPSLISLICDVSWQTPSLMRYISDTNSQPASFICLMSDAVWKLVFLMTNNQKKKEKGRGKSIKIFFDKKIYARKTVRF